MSNIQTNYVNENNLLITSINPHCVRNDEPQGFEDKKCAIEDCFNLLPNSKLFKYCKNHVCNFGTNRDYLTMRCNNKCTSSSIKTCQEHTCAEIHCVEPVVNYGVLYCENHNSSSCTKYLIVIGMVILPYFISRLFF